MTLTGYDFIGVFQRNSGLYHPQNFLICFKSIFSRPQAGLWLRVIRGDAHGRDRDMIRNLVHYANMFSLLAGAGELPNRSVRRISASNQLRFGPKIGDLGQECHIFHCDLPKVVIIPKDFWSWLSWARSEYAKFLLNWSSNPLLNKDITKILPVGLRSAKYGQEYRDCGALKSYRPR